MKKEYSLIELSRYYKCSKTSILAWARSGDLAHKKGLFGSRITYRFESDEVERFKKIRIENNNRINKGKKTAYRRKDVIKKGYRYIWTPGHPKADSDGYVPEHVLVVEKRIGRYLTKKECVHHIDRNRQNNVDSNLVLYKSQGSHMKEAHIYALVIANKIKGNQELIDLVMKYIDNYNKTKN